MTQKNTKPAIDDQTRNRIAEFLPKALASAINSYHAFSCLETENNGQEDTQHTTKNTKSVSKAKTFYDHHNACKVAIAHIELLLDLAKYAHLPDDDINADGTRDNLVSMLEEAQAEYNAYLDRSK